jgi:type IVB pilus formation R64 PilN family outer membrane protein
VKVKPLIHIATLAALGALLGGCSTSLTRDVTGTVTEDATRTTQLLPNVGSTSANAQPSPTVERTAAVWLPVHRNQPSEHLAERPQVLRNAFAVNRVFNNLNDVAERVSLVTGIPVNVAPDALSAIVKAAAQPAGAPVAPFGNAPPGVGAGATTPGVVAISFQGTVGDFLDVVSARYNISWEYRDGRIELFRYMTRTFVLNAIPGDISSKARINNRSGTSGATTGSTGTTESGMETQVNADALAIWKGVDDSLKSLLAEGSKVVVSPALGTVTVTATPRGVAEAKRFIDEQNAQLSKAVVVNVEILAVTLNRSDDYGINWGVVYNNLAKNFGWNFTSAFTPANGTSNLTLNILSSAGASTGADIKAWQGSTAIMSALSSQGDVSVITSGHVVTLNNQPSPLQDGKQTFYLASSATTQAANAGTTTTLTPGIATTGFSMNVLPHITGPDRMLLQYAGDISDLTHLVTVSSGGSSIQTPEISTRNFLHRVPLKSGDTIILSGFEQRRNASNTQGMGSPTATLLGGGVSGSKQRTVFVILLHAVIAEPPAEQNNI